jgi:hypothetical protein
MQISKVCKKSKFQIKFERILSSHFWFSAQPRPTSLSPPSGLAAAHLFPSSFRPSRGPPLSLPFRPSLPRRLPLTDRRAHPVSRPAVFFLRKPDWAPLPPPPTCAAADPMTPPLPEMAPHFPPSSLTTHPSVSPPHRTGRLALMPPPPTDRPIPFPVRPLRSPSEPIKGRGGRPSAPHSSLPPFPTLQARARYAPEFRPLPPSPGRLSASQAPVSGPSGFLRSTPPLLPLGQRPWTSERLEAKPWRARCHRPWPVHRGPGPDMVHRPWTESTDYSVHI